MRHHPVEIRAVLAAARESAQGRVIAVVQPHRFTRLRDLMEEFQNAFNDADIVFAAPVYAAGEQPIEGVDSEALRGGPRARTGTACARTVEAIPTTSCGALRDLACAGRHDRLHGRRRHHQMGAGGARRFGVTARPAVREKRPLATICRAVRGKLTPNAPLAPLVWFKSGGTRRMAVRAGGRRRSDRASSAISSGRCRSWRWGSAPT